MNLSRRGLLTAGAGAATAAVAGCVDAAAPGQENDGGYTAFFTLWDWAEEISGDTLDFENPVSAGQMGHGWSPDGDITRELASSEMFLYLDTPEFSWAQDVATELERDHDEVAVVDALEGLEPYLIPFDTEPMPEPDHGRDYPPESLWFEEVDIYDLRSNQQLGYWHGPGFNHWHGGLPDIAVGDSVPIGVVLKDEAENIVPLGDGESYRVDARLADGESEDVVDIEGGGDHVVFHGESTGTAGIVFQILHEGDVIYETDPEPTSITVKETLDAGGADEFHDPHAWTDPVLAQRMVDNVADALADVDPENEAAYRDNADRYKQRLQSVHEEFEALGEAADREVAVFAGHDSFQYLEQRYAFELHTPVGISPDAGESFDDMTRLNSVIEEHGIDTVLYDPFEAATPGEDLPQMVENIFEETSVDNAEPLSPLEGTTETWQENDWGWVEQMENVNIPSLRKALGAD